MSAENYESEGIIEKIQFCVFGNNEIKNYSAVSKELYGINQAELDDNNQPKRGGLNDTRLGVTIDSMDCATCGLSEKYCQGHIGHTELAEPVFHLGYLPFIKQILSCICIRCSKLLVYKNEDEIEQMLKTLSGKSRFNEIRKATSNVSYCIGGEYGCGVQQPVPKIKIETKKTTTTIQIVAETNLTGVSDENGGLDGKKKIREILTAENCYDILRNISDIDCKIMGFDPAITRPEDLIIKNFIIPPVCIRPSVKADFMSAGTFEDTLTHKLTDIVKSNLRIRKEKEKALTSGEPSKYTNENVHLLQYHIGTYYDNDSMALPKSEQRGGGKAVKSITERIKGKQGRIRGNLMGKRVNFSGRTVITSEPNIGIDELGVPIKIAMNLTFPEIVTPENYDRLTKLVRNGRTTYPGANYVIPVDNNGSSQNKQIDLRYRKKTIKLRYGDIVERHLVDGDPVLFNRQPSLHKLSMMGHRVRVIPDLRLNTFRLNVSVTAPYNADFDGDEMNIFVPQSIQSQIEIGSLADVKQQIITPRTSKPIIAHKQDTVIGSYLMTLLKNRVSWSEAMNLSMYLDNIENMKLKKGEDIDSAILYSKILPSSVNVTQFDDKGNKKIDIINGNIKGGEITGDVLKSQLITNIWDKNGPQTTKDFIDNAQKLVSNWLLQDGFTVGLGDTYVDDQTMTNIETVIEAKKLEIRHLITEMENNPDMMDPLVFEESIMRNLDAFKGEIAKLVMNSLTPKNNFYTMIISKAKGDQMNLAQIVSNLGQQILEFMRIKKKVNKRSLPHFYQNDDTPEARGFIENSYLKGLEPHEFFFHVMSGREGLIDTAIKTSDTGYISRKLIKALEDVMIKYDGTVRSGNNIIVQLAFGDNGVNVISQKPQKIGIIGMNNSKLHEKHEFTNDELKELSKKHKLEIKKLEESNNKYVKTLLDMRDSLRNIQRLALRLYMVFTETYMLPVNLTRIINDNKNAIYVEDKGEALSPLYITEKIDYVIKPEITKLMCLSKKQMTDTKSIKYRDQEVFKYLFIIALHDYLSPKRCIYEYKLSKYKFDKIVNDIIKSYNKSLFEAGEMVGVVSAQSIGEISTQMTLNTFHSTGSGSVGMQGVPRIRELISCTKNIKTPMMLVYLNDEYKKSRPMAHRISSYIKNIIINDVVSKVEVIYDPNVKDKDSYNSMDKTESIFFVSNKATKSLENMPWIIRLQLNREQMIDKEVSMLDIKTKFITWWNDQMADIKSGLKKTEKDILGMVSNIAICSNMDNSKNPMVHIRFDLNNFNMTNIIELQNVILNNFKLKGIPNIENINKIDEQNCIEFDNKTGDVLTNKQNVIITDGINLVDIRYINGVDLTKTISNHVIDVLEVFGIEAARSVLIKELFTVFESSGSVNYQHIELLVDIMTNTGVLTSIDRHGINRLDTDPLSRASFEKSIEQLLTAAVFGQIDYVRSVSSRIMTGRAIAGGTGLCEILLDSKMIENTEYNDDYTTIDTKGYKGISSTGLLSSILKGKHLSGYIGK